VCWRWDYSTALHMLELQHHCVQEVGLQDCRTAFLPRYCVLKVPTAPPYYSEGIYLCAAPHYSKGFTVGLHSSSIHFGVGCIGIILAVPLLSDILSWRYIGCKHFYPHLNHNTPPSSSHPILCLHVQARLSNWCVCV